MTGNGRLSHAEIIVVVKGSVPRLSTYGSHSLGMCSLPE